MTHYGPLLALAHKTMEDPIRWEPQKMIASIAEDIDPLRFISKVTVAKEVVLKFPRRKMVVVPIMPCLVLCIWCRFLQVLPNLSRWSVVLRGGVNKTGHDISQGETHSFTKQIAVCMYGIFTRGT